MRSEFDRKWRRVRRTCTRKLKGASENRKFIRWQKAANVRAGDREKFFTRSKLTEPISDRILLGKKQKQPQPKSSRSSTHLKRRRRPFERAFARALEFKRQSIARREFCAPRLSRSASATFSFLIFFCSLMLTRSTPTRTRSRLATTTTTCCLMRRRQQQRRRRRWERRASTSLQARRRLRQFCSRQRARRRQSATRTRCAPKLIVCCRSFASPFAPQTR